MARCARWSLVVSMVCFVSFPELGRAQALTLKQVLAHAELHAPSMIEARARSGLADAAMQAARPWLADNPELAFGVGPRTQVDADPDLDFRISLQQRVELGGQRAARIDAARSVRRVEDAKLSAAKFALRVSVRAAFYTVLIEAQHLQSTTQIAAVQARIVEIASGRLAAGDIGPLALRLAQADFAQAEQIKIAAELSLQMAQLRLQMLAGLPDDASVNVEGTLPDAIAPGDVAKLIEQARASQPDKRVALAELAEREQRLNVASREGWAGPTLGVDFAHEDGNQNVVLATISVPLPFASPHPGARAQARAETEISRAELAARDQELPNRVRAAALAAASAARRIAAYKADLIPRFEESLQLIRHAFELGELTALEVSTAQARLIEAQRGAQSTYHDYFDAITALQMETGTELSLGDER